MMIKERYQLFFPAFVIMYFLAAYPMRASAQPKVEKGGVEQTLQEFSRLPDTGKQALLSTTGMDFLGGFSWANIIAWMIFGGIGFIAFVYGKKQGSLQPLIIGLVLMIYPYFVTNTLGLYLAGGALCALLYFWRD